MSLATADNVITVVGNRLYWRVEDLKQNIMLDIDAYPIFKLHHYKWMISYNWENKWLGLNVHCSDTCDQFGVHLGLAGEAFEEIKCKVAEIHKNKRTFKLMNLICVEELLEIKMSNRFLYLFADIEKSNGQMIQEHENSGISQYQLDFEALFLSGDYSDIIIKVGDDEFKCHKNVLGARSAVFKAMLKHKMKENLSGIVIIEDTQPEAFREFLLFLYTENKHILNRKNVTELYELADKYAVKSLKSHCKTLMKKTISLETFFEYFHLSWLHQETEISEIAIQFFKQNSKKIVENEKWLMFLSENLLEANILIKALASDRTEFLKNFL